MPKRGKRSNWTLTRRRPVTVVAAASAVARRIRRNPVTVGAPANAAVLAKKAVENPQRTSDL